MRWSLAAAFLLAPVLSYPIPYRMPSRLSTDIEVLEYDGERAYTKFELAPGIQVDELTTALVFELQVHPTEDLLASNITLNSQALDVKWTNKRGLHRVNPTTQTLSITDRFGFPHFLHISLDGELDGRPAFPSAAVQQSISIHINSIDGVSTGLNFEIAGFQIASNPTVQRRLTSITSIALSRTIDFDTVEKSSMISQADHHATMDGSLGHDGDSFDIETEIKSLLLLEAEASKLNSAIAIKKQAIAKLLKNHRDQVTLKHLLEQCDSLVCAAKVIAQRICDKMGIYTMPRIGYALIQDEHMQHLIDVEENNEKSQSATKVEMATEKSSKKPSSDVYATAAIQPLELVQPQNVLFRVLGVIASVLGLATLFRFICRKCMSVRRRVECAADREERRTARAYRRAARRAEMRRRWDALVRAISCFTFASDGPRTGDYEEKRALILQDAFLESQRDLDTAATAEIMEAEIRELRHAHELVANLVRVVDENDTTTTTLRLVADPPPPFVPLPSTPTGRSRASTATLPSYTSEALPDYTSRYAKTEIESSSGHSLRSLSLSTSSENFTVSSSLMASSSTDGGSITLVHSPSSRSPSPGGSRASATSRTSSSRLTATSSIIETSPRPSDDTLRMGC